jgi:hypothetical protein
MVEQLPEGSFWYELARMTAVDLRRKDKRSQWARTLDADIADLHEALEASGRPDRERAELIKVYRVMRGAMRDATPDAGTFHSRPLGLPTLSPWAPTPPVPPDPEAKRAAQMARFELSRYPLLLGALPEEFVLYVRGADAYRLEDYEGAVREWVELLNLPAEQRPYRSTWATFMIGKAWLCVDPAKAIPFFEQTRQLAAEGFRDSLGLRNASLGWQAMLEHRAGDQRAAIHRYFEMYKNGDEWDGNTAYISLRWVCDRLFQNGGPTPDLLEDTLCYRVLAAWAVSRPSGPILSKWVAVFADAGIDPPQDLAGRLAWAAYRAGNLPTAETWLTKAEDDCVYGGWLSAKLAFRNGDEDRAVQILQSIKASFAKDDQWRTAEDPYFPTVPHKRVLGDLAYLLLGRQDYLGALDAFLRGGYAEDTAYVAERMATPGELEEYLRSNAEDPELTDTSPGRRWGPGSGTSSPLEELRYLYARRLARAGQFEKARDYYPPGTLQTWRSYYGAGEELNPREKIEEYAVHLKAGRDPANPRRDRADHLYAAARIAREYGMELFGTDYLPDWNVLYGGGFYFDVPSRLSSGEASQDEIERYHANAPRPEKRFHYRYQAADLMWECARLLPDNDELTARALYHGGTWLKTRDPQAADRFYKALVRRCRKLPIGQEADQLRWFPPDPP